MKIRKFTFGTPEEIVPSRYCKNFHYQPTEPIAFDPQTVEAKAIAGGYLLEFPIAAEEQIYGFGLQLKQFNHKGKKSPCVSMPTRSRQQAIPTHRSHFL